METATTLVVDCLLVTVFPSAYSFLAYHLINMNGVLHKKRWINPKTTTYTTTLHNKLQARPTPLLSIDASTTAYFGTYSMDPL